MLVAHNAAFDCTFLEAELVREGVRVPPLAALCTMRLPNQLGLRAGRLRLADCCAAAGIDYEPTHAAYADAQACALLFESHVLRLNAAGLDTLAALGCATPATRDAWPTSTLHHAPKTRERVPPAASEPAFLSVLAQEASGLSGPVTVEVASYLDVLDRALEDRSLSDAEQIQLANVASMLDLSASQVRSIHADYLGTLIALAYRDGVVTDRERADLELVAETLGIEGVDEIISKLGDARGAESSTRVGDHPLAGKSVCFTGRLLCSLDGRLITREEAHQLASGAGLVVAGNVTKKLDLLVVADPYSLSGKTQKARTYGTRIVAETAFWPMIGVEVD